MEEEEREAVSGSGSRVWILGLIISVAASLLGGGFFAGGCMEKPDRVHPVPDEPLAELPDLQPEVEEASESAEKQVEVADAVAEKALERRRREADPAGPTVKQIKEMRERLRRASELLKDSL